MIPWLEDVGDFPPSNLALTAADDADGLLCASQSISAELLAKSYLRGIYPWYSGDDPVLWWTPSQRAVLMCHNINISHSLAKTLRKWQHNGDYRVTIDTAFEQVMQACADRPQGTWMTPELRRAYLDWHTAGKVHSVEVWQHQQLVGGLYGVSLGHMFYGESMFSRVSDASKVALACFNSWFALQGGQMIDCQQDTAHLKSLGAHTMPRDEFEQALTKLTRQPDLPWLQAKQIDLLAAYHPIK